MSIVVRAQRRALLALALLAAGAAVVPATATAADTGPPGPAPYPAQIGSWAVPDVRDGSGVGWSIAVDSARHVVYVAELLDLVRDGRLQTTVRICAYSPTGRALASVDLRSSASAIDPQRPLIAIDGNAGIAYVALGDTLDAGATAPIARLSTPPAPSSGPDGPPALTPPPNGPATIDFPLQPTTRQIVLKDLAVDPVTHELVLLARAVPDPSSASGGLSIARFDPESGARTTLVARDPAGNAGGPERSRITVGPDGTVWLLSQRFETPGAPAGVWRFPTGVHDETIPATPFYASRNVTNPLAPPPGFGIAGSDPLDELSPAIVADDAGRLLVPFAAPVAPPPLMPVPERIGTGIAVLDPAHAAPIGDPAFPGAEFAPVEQVIPGDGVADGALPFGADAGNYSCHLGQDEATDEYDFAVDREAVGPGPASADVLYVLTKRQQTHHGAVVLRIGPHLPGSFSCFAPPYARLGGVPATAVAPGTTVHLDVGGSVDPNLGDRYLQPRGIFRVEWDLTSDRFAPGDDIVKRQVPLGTPPDTRLDLRVERTQAVSVRVWNAAGLSSNVRTATIRVAAAAASSGRR